jgi:uncharacterized repeat protein (TIGR02543 family)
LGGGIVHSSRTSLYLNACTITGNRSISAVTGTGGAGIYSSPNTAIGNQSTSTLYVQNGTVVSNNTSAQYGGGIYCNASSTLSGNLVLRACTIEDNNAVQSGGGVIINGSNLTIDDSNCIIRRNHSNSAGGGIVITNATTGVTSIGIISAACTIGGATAADGNTSEGSGGGIALGGTGNMLTISANANIHSNTAVYGGGIAVTGTNDTLTISANVNIRNNTATSYGGGMYINNAVGVRMADGTISENSSNNGGGVVVTTGASFTMSGGIIGGAIAAEGNSAANGGGIFIMGNNTTVTVSSGTIRNNKATYSGGGIYANGSAGTALTINTVSGATTIRDNTAASSGGGIYLTPYANSMGTLFTIASGVTFTGNSAGSIFSLQNPSGAYTYYASRVAVPNGGWSAIPGGYTGPTTGSNFTYGFNHYDIGFATRLITYYGNGNTGGSVPPQQGVVASSDGAISDAIISGNTGNLIKTGYRFTGWNTNAAGTGTDYPAASSVSLTSNLTLYAQWCELPEQPEITGPGSVCAGSTNNQYSVTNESGVTYTWTVPAGWNITSGQNSATISATAGSSGGNITVTPSNDCGEGTEVTFPVTATKPEIKINK